MGLFSHTPVNYIASSIVSDCYTMSEVPGKTIEKSLGLVQYTETYVDENIIAKIDGIFQSLLQIAHERGANAIINVKITTGTYSKVAEWVTTYIIVYGEAVVLKPITQP